MWGASPMFALRNWKKNLANPHLVMKYLKDIYIRYLQKRNNCE